MMAKIGARDEQPENPVCLAESKTIIKALYRTSPPPDSYHSLTRQDQVTIFRLRTGHCRLNQHLHRKMKVVPSPMCSCGEAEQDTRHILQGSQAAERRNVAEPITPRKKTVRASGCPTDDRHVP